MTKTRYEFSEDYIKNNKKHMNEQDLRNLEKKQYNRRVQIECLEENIRND